MKVIFIYTGLPWQSIRKIVNLYQKSQHLELVYLECSILQQNTNVVQIMNPGSILTSTCIWGHLILHLLVQEKSLKSFLSEITSTRVKTIFLYSIFFVDIYKIVHIMTQGTILAQPRSLDSTQTLSLNIIQCIAWSIGPLR